MGQVNIAGVKTAQKIPKRGKEPPVFRGAPFCFVDVFLERDSVWGSVPERYAKRHLGKNQKKSHNYLEIREIITILAYIRSKGFFTYRTDGDSSSRTEDTNR